MDINTHLLVFLIVISSLAVKGEIKTPTDTEGFINFISSSAAYKKADFATKKKILDKLKSQKVWPKEYANIEADRVAIGLLEEATKGLKPEEKGIKGLQLMSKMKEEKFMSWIRGYPSHEKYYLTLYLINNASYQKMNPVDKVKFLTGLAKKKIITPFALSDFESPVIAEMLLNDPKFRKLGAKEKKEYIEKMEKSGKMHMFSEGKIIKMLEIK